MLAERIGLARGGQPAIGHGERRIVDEDAHVVLRNLLGHQIRRVRGDRRIEDSLFVEHVRVGQELAHLIRDHLGMHHAVHRREVRRILVRFEAERRRDRLKAVDAGRGQHDLVVGAIAVEVDALHLPAELGELIQRGGNLRAQLLEPCRIVADHDVADVRRHGAAEAPDGAVRRRHGFDVLRILLGVVGDRMRRPLLEVRRDIDEHAALAALDGHLHIVELDHVRIELAGGELDGLDRLIIRIGMNLPFDVDIRVFLEPLPESEVVADGRIRVVDRVVAADGERRLFVAQPCAGILLGKSREGRTEHHAQREQQ